MCGFEQALAIIIVYSYFMWFGWGTSYHNDIFLFSVVWSRHGYQKNQSYVMWFGTGSISQTVRILFHVVWSMH